MKSKKIQKSYLDYGFGFPVQILNAPLSKVRGEWVLDIDFEKYEKAVLLALALKPARLTGNEITFIRNHFSMTLKSFGKRFGDVAHSAVIKWEKFKDDPTNMNWPTEKDIRLFIINELNPTILVSVYKKLEKVASPRSSKIKIDSEDLIAA
jgi:DNA-binding transcriptional regulator YiaG